MRFAVCLLVVLAIGAITWADPPSGTVIISCNEEDASIIVDGVLLPERTPAVLTLSAGTHVIEARKPPLLAQKQTIELADHQQLKLRFDLVSAAPPPAADAGIGSGSSAPPPTGSAAPPAVGSAQVTNTGSAAPPVTAPMPLPAEKPAERHCRSGGREVPCPPEGPHCISGCGKPPPPAPLPKATPPPPAVTAGVGTGAGPGASPTTPAEPRVPSGLAAIEIATTAPNAIAYVDGAPVQAAPCVLELEPGEHVVAVYAAGMVPAEAVVRADVARRQRIELVPSQPRQRIDVPAQ